MKYQIPEVKLLCLRECQVDNPMVDQPDNAVAFWRGNIPQASWFDADCETVVVLLVNTRKRIVGFARVSSGTLDTCLVHPREVFKLAIVQGAAAVILMHNHPSGDSTPSESDIKITRDLMRAGQLLKIELLDHIVVGEKTATGKGYSSLRELGYLYANS
jgi:DNA repair protein RadC